jgi:hypothetical protein
MVCNRLPQAHTGVKLQYQPGVSYKREISHGELLQYTEQCTTVIKTYFFKIPGWAMAHGIHPVASPLITYDTIDPL